MGSGGNILDNVVKEVGDGLGAVGGAITGGVSDIADITKTAVDQLGGENARRDKAAKKKQLQKAKEAQAKARLEEKARLDNAKSIEAATLKRDSSSAAQKGRRKKGRSSTILTGDMPGGEANLNDTLGESSSEGKKNLLGL